MVPYLQCLRGILDTVDAHADDVDENTLEEFSESEDEEEEEEEDDEDDDAAEDSYDSEGGEEAYDSENDAYDSEAEAECGDDADADAGGGAKKQGLRVVEGMVASPPAAAAAAAAAARAQSHSRPKPTVVPVRLKKPSKGGSKSSKGASERSEYQIEKRARYNLFARFLGSYFASERVEKAGVAELLNHPDAAGFGDDEVVSFLDMMTRENKVMLDEGTKKVIYRRGSKRRETRARSRHASFLTLRGDTGGDRPLPPSRSTLRLRSFAAPVALVPRAARSNFSISHARLASRSLSVSVGPAPRADRPTLSAIISVSTNAIAVVAAVNDTMTTIAAGNFPATVVTSRVTFATSSRTKSRLRSRNGLGTSAVFPVTGSLVSDRFGVPRALNPPRANSINSSAFLCFALYSYSARS
eukprot:31508-Pelagococcus_subviridis.AAC.3